MKKTIITSSLLAGAAIAAGLLASSPKVPEVEVPSEKIVPVVENIETTNKGATNERPLR